MYANNGWIFLCKTEGLKLVRMHLMLYSPTIQSLPKGCNTEYFFNSLLDEGASPMQQASLCQQMHIEERIFEMT